MLIVFSKCFSVGRVDETLFVFLQASIGGAIRKLKFGNQSYTQKESFRYEAGSRGSWLSGYCWSNWSVRAATKQIMLNNVQVWFWLRSIVTTHKDVLPEKETFCMILPGWQGFRFQGLLLFHRCQDVEVVKIQCLEIMLALRSKNAWLYADVLQWNPNVAGNHVPLYKSLGPELQTAVAARW